MIIYVNGKQVEVEAVEIYHPPFWKPQPKKESDTVSNEKEKEYGNTKV
jgi:hypothetical protein